MLNLKIQLPYIYRAHRYRYILDSNEVSFMLKSLQKGDIAVDIGAHKGGYLYWMRKAVGTAGHCFAFEPQEALFQYLRKVTEGYSNVTLEKLGVSSIAGSKDLYVPGKVGKSSPGATLEVHKFEQEDAQRFKIQTSTLDEYFLEKGSSAPSLVKIDVEGHEFEVLKGGEKLLARHKPKLIIECEQRHLETDISVVFKYLENFGYEGYFYHDGKPIDIGDFDPSLYQKQIGDRYWAAKDYINNFVFS